MHDMRPFITSRTPAYPAAIVAAIVSALAPGATPAAAQLSAGETPPPPTCEVVWAGQPLPPEVRESSGMARSIRDPAVFWTHNDAGNDPELFAIDADGQLVQRVHVTGAELIDWEDMEIGPCAPADDDARSCLYIGDIGDNDGRRERITIYQVAEPAPGAEASEPATALPARYPDGPKDAEGLFLGTDGSLYIVTKGRTEPITLYRYAAPLRPDTVVTLERVRELLPRPGRSADYVTAATSTPDRRWLIMRSYRTLYIYRARSLLDGGDAAPVTFDLAPLGETQGEAIAIADAGEIRLSSEAENRREPPAWSLLRCVLAG